MILLKGENGHVAEGEAVLADRGDRMSLCCESYTAEMEIDYEGRLVFLRNDGSIASHEPGSEPVIMHDGVETIVFERVADVLREDYPCAWSEDITFVGVDKCDRPTLRFSLLTSELFRLLAQQVGSNEAVDVLAWELQWELEKAVDRAFEAVVGADSSFRHLRVPVQARRSESDVG
jgi:hypothetical protein